MTVVSRKLTAVLSFRGILEERRIIFFDYAVLKGIFIFIYERGDSVC